MEHWEQEATPEELVEVAGLPEKKVVLTRRGNQMQMQPQPQLQIKPAPPLPDSAKTEMIASRVCAREGHNIEVIRGVKQMTADGRIIEADGYLCTKCGFNLAEIRGQ
jgi:hypothetical protein